MHSTAHLYSGPAMETLFRGIGDESRVAIIGHRGCGKNKISLSGIHEEHPMPTIMENTIVSFNLAANSGADFVEFDVQVTKDGHPIIFHDDLIIYNEKENDCLVEKRICDLTLEEFLSIGYQKDSQTIEKELLRKTADGTLAVWNTSVNDSLCTLKEAFLRVSPTIGFNIELKFDNYNPIPHWDLKASIQSILEVVHGSAMERKVFFSTFHPDAALLLRQHQSIYPVLFLTDGVPNTYPDVRRNSLTSAIDVCLSGNLQGIVSEVKAILNNPDAVQKIKAAQLRLLTYGEFNNIPEILHLQQELSVDGVVVDHVSKMVVASFCKSKGPIMTLDNVSE